MNQFGNIFKIQIYGESHGEGIGVIIDGVPSGIPLKKEHFYNDLKKRKSGKLGTTKRIEDDIPIFISGVFNNFTTGAPLNIFFKNNNTNSKVYSDFKSHPRPGHADFTSTCKFNGYNDLRGGGHFSGRLSLAIVAAGVVAKKILKNLNIIFKCKIDKIGKLPKEKFETTLKRYLEYTLKKGDSLGGIISLKASNIPIGLGDPFFNSIESHISSIIFSIPGIKGIEFGSGFNGCLKYGSEFNDCFINKLGKTKTNNTGGINGGITNGNSLYFKVAVRPTASIFKSQNTFDFSKNKLSELKILGRHDVAFILRVPIIIENATAIALVDLFLLNKIYKN